MPQQVDPAAGLADRLLDGGVQAVADQQIGTVGIQADTGEVGPVAHPLQPGKQFDEIEVAAQKAGNNDHR